MGLDCLFGIKGLANEIMKIIKLCTQDSEDKVQAVKSSREKEYKPHYYIHDFPQSEDFKQRVQDINFLFGNPAIKYKFHDALG